jgi:endonuclease G
MGMIKTYLISFLLLISFTVSAQDLVTIQHKAYKTTYSKSKNYPVKVEWWLTKAMISCPTKVKRTDNFGPDPKQISSTNVQQYYNSSGYDRGHNFPAADGACDVVSMTESFYFSNMTPQTPQLNRGDWKTVEELTRLEASQYDSVYVWTGSVGEVKKIGALSVPKQCWKVLYIKKTKEWFAFLFNNDNSKPNGINDNKVEVKLVEQISGYKFRIK